MDIDPLAPATDAADEAAAGSSNDASRLSSRVAITVALLATFLGVCKVKDDNIVQAMQQAQVDRLDHWSFYQARNIREDVARASAVQLRLQVRTAAPGDRPSWEAAIADAQARVDDEAHKKADLQRQAEADATLYDTLNYRDDQFDLSDALGAIAVSLLAMTALTHKPWLYVAALVPTLLCVLMGLAGLAGWHVHPDALARLLS